MENITKLDPKMHTPSMYVWQNVDSQGGVNTVDKLIPF